MKVLLMQHGEKLVIFLVLIIAGLWINGVSGDPTTLPKTDKIGIDQKIEKTKDYIAQPAPTPEKPMDYTGTIQKRLAINIEHADTLQFLTKHPDIVEGSTGNRSVYSIYEVYTPEVSLTDEVGSIEVVVNLPQNDGGRGDEVRNGAEETWTRELANGETVTNRARWLGVKVEYRIGLKGEWLPLRSAGTGGIYLFKDNAFNDPSFRHNGIQGKQQYSYRASLLVGATGIREEGKPEIGEEIIVYDGDYNGAVDRFVWAQQSGRISGRLQPVDAKQLPVTIPLNDREKLYTSKAGEVSAVEETESDIIFALYNISALGGGDPTMRLLMTKMVRDRNGDILGWTEPLDLKKIQIGERIGTPPEGQKGFRVKLRNLSDMGMRSVDFQTDWVLSDLNLDAKRIFYYEVKKKRVEPSEQYPEGDMLYLDERARQPYQTATLSNGLEKIVLVKLDRRQFMHAKDRPYCYPLLPGGAEKFEELDSFKEGDPRDFIQPVLQPEKPTEYPPDELPPDGVPVLFQTNIPYFVFPDGRIVWWDHINRELRSTELAPPPEEEPEDGADADGEAGEEAAGEVPPEGMEPPPPQP